jgi:signal transduction histidine kinase
VAGCAFAALARIGSLTSVAMNERLWLTDALRVGGYMCWLTGAAWATASYWEAAVRLALIEDRRRIAEELHDGVAQDLAFILMQSRLAARLSDESHIPAVVTASERALAQTRQAIQALSSMRPPSDEPSLATDVAGAR